MPDHTQQLKDFIANCENREWLNVGFGKVYVRKSHRIFDGKIQPAFDVASIEVKTKNRGKGFFKAWLKIVEKFCDKLDLPVYVENVLDKRFREFFEKQGYRSHDTWACYYKPPSSWHKTQIPS